MKPAKKIRRRCARARKPRPEQIIAAQALVPLPPLAMVRSPQAVIEEAVAAADALTQVLDKRKKKVRIKGERYLCYDDWQTVARFFGITARVTRTEHVALGDHHGFKANAEAVLVANGQVIASTDALCLTDEPKWNTKPVYQEGENGKRVHTHDEAVPHFQRLSMAQTRACAKAIRSVCSWVVVLAGFAPTPAEEMDGFNQETGYGACGKCGTDMYFEDEAKSGICRSCKRKAAELADIKDHNFIEKSVAAVNAKKAAFALAAQGANHHGN